MTCFSKHSSQFTLNPFMETLTFIVLSDEDSSPRQFLTHFYKKDHHSHAVVVILLRKDTAGNLQKITHLLYTYCLAIIPSK